MRSSSITLLTKLTLIFSAFKKLPVPFLLQVYTLILIFYKLLIKGLSLSLTEMKILPLEGR